MKASGRPMPLSGVTCFLVAMIEGFDLQAAGVAAPMLAPIFHLSPAAIGLFFTAATIGLAVGAMIGGRIADRSGRRAGLIVALVWFGIASLATTLAWNAASLMTLRFLTGLGLGAAMPNLIAIRAEGAPPGRGASAVAAMYGGMPAGGVVAALVASVDHAGGWTTIFLLGGLAPLAVLPLVLRVLPASPIADGAPGSSSSRPYRALFAGAAARTTPLLWVAFFFTLLILYLLLNWLPVLLVGGGLDRGNAGLVQMFFNAVGALACIAIGPIIDRAGAPRPAAVLSALLLVALASLALSPGTLVLAIPAAGVVGGSLLAIQAILYGLAPALYEAEIRGTGVGAAVAMGRLGSIAGPLVAGSLVTAGLSSGALLGAIVPLALLGCLATLATLRSATAVAIAPPEGGAA